MRPNQQTRREQILSLTRTTPMTFAQIAEALNLHPTSVQFVISNARRNGDTSIFRIAGYVQNVEGKAQRALIGPGPSPDCQATTIQQRILDALATAPMSRAELSEVIGASIPVVQNALSRMRAEKLTRIHSYVRSPREAGSRIIRIHGLGAEPDAPMPQPLDPEYSKQRRAEASARWWERKKVNERNSSRAASSAGALNLQSAFMAMRHTAAINQQHA